MKHNASNSRKWFKEFDPNLLAACVNGKMQNDHESVVSKPKNIPEFNMISTSGAKYCRSYANHSTAFIQRDHVITCHSHGKCIKSMRLMLVEELSK
jgi:hypothetical protein